MAEQQGADQDDAAACSSSNCLLLQPDDALDKPGVQMIAPVLFQRDERGEGSLDEAAADLLGIHGEQVRCFSVPGMEKRLGLSIHMYIDLQGVQHGLAHNTNATQLWLIANLPEEPPSLIPAAIHGPVLLSAENFKTEEYVDLTEEDWTKIRSLCRAIQPNAQFLPYQAPTEEEEAREQEQGQDEWR